MSRIVVIDDSKLMRNLVRHLLEEAGHEVETWEEVTASDIPDRLRAANPDLVITDYMMPGCNGLTVAKRVKMAKPGLPVVVLTATHDPAVTDALNRQDVSRILFKPLREEELLQVVKQLT